MDTNLNIPVDVPLLGDERRKNWAKVVTRVDDTKASGWAFDGEFIAAGGVQDVPSGAVILVYGERGGRTNPAVTAGVFIANSDGTLSERKVVKGRAWARSLRDEVESLLVDATCPPTHGQPTHGQTTHGAPLADAASDLAAYSDSALLAELARRGRRVQFG